MNNAEEILVIFLSTALAIFLAIGIFTLIKVNKILDHVNHITEKAERIADNAEHVSEFFQKTTASAAIGKLVANVLTSIKGSNEKHHDE